MTIVTTPSNPRQEGDRPSSEGDTAINVTEYCVQSSTQSLDSEAGSGDKCHELHFDPPTLDDEELTEAELRVFRLVPMGLPHNEMALQLFLDVRTIQTHMDSIYTKCGVKSFKALLSKMLWEERGRRLLAEQAAERGEA